MLNKIYRRITDFRGNKVINIRTNTPVHDEEIPNKKYVDDSQIFNTPDSEQYDKPFTFDWMSGVNNRTFTEILNDLFFGNKSLSFVDGTLLDSIVNISTKTNVFNTLTSTQSVLHYHILLNDRSKVLSKKIISKFPDNSTTEVVINDGILVGENTFNMSNQTQVILEVTYAPFAPKTNDRGEQYEPENNGNKSYQYVVYDDGIEHHIYNINGVYCKSIQALYASKSFNENQDIITSFNNANSLADINGMLPLNGSISHNITKDGYYYDNNILILIQSNFSDLLRGALIGMNTDTFNQSFNINSLELVANKTLNGQEYYMYTLPLKTKENRTIFNLTI